MVDIEETHRLCDSGFTLSVEEKSKLQISIIQRKNDEGFSKLYFWGKILGKEADYLICYGLLPSYDFPQKKFYFCTTSTFELAQLPEVSSEFAEKASSVEGMFKGDPAFLLDGEEPPEETEDGAPVPEVFREVHRLAQTIKEIDFDTATVPRGAWLVAPSHQIVENKGYEGLNYEAASNLSSYFHFREAVHLETKSAIEKQGLVRATDFLDPLSCDEPRNSWVLQRNSSKTSTSLRSLIWPGYYFFHTIETNHYGGAYFGYGQKNSDIAFML